MAARRFDHPQAGSHTLGDAISQFVLGDVLIHTWDLARATGQDETLDPHAVHEMLSGLEHMDERILVDSGHYAPRVEVPGEAGEQAKLLALTGRAP